MSNGIFAVDRRAWNRVCDFGVNVAISYLILARGSGGDNRTTSWSTQAIEQKTSISRPRAKASLQLLVDNRLLLKLRAGKRPRYKIQPPEDFLGATGSFTEKELAVIHHLRDASPSHPKGWQAVARDLISRGRISITESDAPAAIHYSDPDWVWLPNTLIDGTASETPPIELLRQTQDINAIRFFINLYYSHHLETNGGVEWRAGSGIYTAYERVKLFEYGEWVIWGFPKRSTTGCYKLPAIESHHNAPRVEKASREKTWEELWNAKRILTSTGLLYEVTHIVDGMQADSEIVHPFPIEDGAEHSEYHLKRAADDLCDRLLPPELRLQKSKYWAVIPVKRHLANATLVGILRMKYRPHTSATAAWVALSESHRDWAKLYEMQYQGLIKVASR